MTRKFEFSCETMAREMLTDADNFALEFPKEADPTHKALLVGCKTEIIFRKLRLLPLFPYRLLPLLPYRLLPLLPYRFF